MFSFFRKRKAEPEKLTWWEGELSRGERQKIEQAFRPLGGTSAEKVVNSGSISQIGTLVGHLSKEPIRGLGYTLLRHADSLVSAEKSVIARHFYWSSRGQFFYRWRDVDDFALEEAINSFQKQVDLSDEARIAFLNDGDLGFVPAHTGYRQLRIIEEKRGDFSSALTLCQQAKAQGWKDDWDKHIVRIMKKIEIGGK